MSQFIKCKSKNCDNEVHKMSPTGYCVACLSNGLHREKEDLESLVKELFVLLDTKEESDSGRIFKPTYITSCRVMHSIKLKEILPKIRKLLKK